MCRVTLRERQGNLDNSVKVRSVLVNKQSALHPSCFGHFHVVTVTFVGIWRVVFFFAVELRSFKYREFGVHETALLLTC